MSCYDLSISQLKELLVLLNVPGRSYLTRKSDICDYLYQNHSQELAQVISNIAPSVSPRKNQNSRSSNNTSLSQNTSKTSLPAQISPSRIPTFTQTSIPAQISPSRIPTYTQTSIPTQISPSRIPTFKQTSLPAQISPGRNYTIYPPISTIYSQLPQNRPKSSTSITSSSQNISQSLTQQSYKNQLLRYCNKLDYPEVRKILSGLNVRGRTGLTRKYDMCEFLANNYPDAIVQHMNQPRSSKKPQKMKQVSPQKQNIPTVAQESITQKNREEKLKIIESELSNINEEDPNPIVPFEILLKIIYESEPSDIVNFCNSYKGLKEYCQREKFWYEIIKYKYPNVKFNINDIVRLKTSWKDIVFLVKDLRRNIDDNRFWFEYFKLRYNFDANYDDVSSLDFKQLDWIYDRPEIYANQYGIDWSIDVDPSSLNIEQKIIKGGGLIVGSKGLMPAEKINLGSYITLKDMLKKIYEYYQEPLPLNSIIRKKSRYPYVDNIIRLLKKGEQVKRIELMGDSLKFESITPAIESNLYELSLEW